MILTVLFLTDKNGYNNKKDFQSTKKKALKKKNQNSLHSWHPWLCILEIKERENKNKKVKWKK